MRLFGQACEGGWLEKGFAAAEGYAGEERVFINPGQDVFRILVTATAGGMGVGILTADTMMGTTLGKD